MKIGFIGLGNVGGKLASSLLRNKFELIVRDLNKNLTKDFQNKSAKIANTPLEISPLIVKIFKDGEKKYGSRAWSLMIVKRMKDLNNVDFRANGFPDELIDNEQEEKGYEI